MGKEIIEHKTTPVTFNQFRVYVLYSDKMKSEVEMKDMPILSNIDTSNIESVRISIRSSISNIKNKFKLKNSIKNLKFNIIL